MHAVFEKLDRSHNSDADDVALHYVQKLQTSPHRTIITSALQQHPTLKSLLIRIMHEGWTSAQEKAAIEFLKGL